MDTKRIRTELTQKMVDSLREGVIPWRKPWRSAQPGLPRNLDSRRYSGVNILLLSQAAMHHDYDSPYWGTYRAWQAAGAQVRKGQKSTKIVYFKPLKRKEKLDDGDTVEKTIPLLRTYSVFNLDQVEGDKVDHLRPVYEPQHVSEEDADWSAADGLIQATHADIRHGESQAYYAKPIGTWPDHTAGDFIGLPYQDRFINSAGYYSTVFYEMSHWTEVRVGWTGSYAMGELIAEMASCFVCSELGLPQSDDLSNHTAYLQSWLKAMGDDPKFIFAASTQASKVVDFLLSHIASSENDPQAVPMTADARRNSATQVQM